MAGGFNDTHSYDWNGQICDFRIYDNCLTPEDVKRLYDCALMDIVATNKNGGFFYDKSGVLINDLISTGVTYSGNSMYFNGTSSQIRPTTNGKGLNISGGTLSVWFVPSAAPTGYQILFIDSVSKMALGFLNSSWLICSCNGSYTKQFSTANIQYGKINHIVICYGSDYSSQYCYINGVKATTGTTNYWTETSGLTIGCRQYNAANSRFNGYISKVTVYKNQLTEQEAVAMYEKEQPILKEGF